MSYQTNKQYFEDHIKGGFDISKREIRWEDKQCFICFLNSLSDSKLMNELIKGLYNSTSMINHIQLFPGSVSECNDKKQAVTSILSGQCLLLFEDKMYLIEVRSYPNQSSNEASNEQSIRGSHDSLVENIILNVGLIRRRIKDPNLQVKLHQEGNASKTDIAYLYVDGLIDETVLKDFEKRLREMNTTEIVYERSLTDALYGKSYNPYPIVRYCERPDICAIHLLQGYLVVLVDNSFTALIVPTTFFEMTKQIEEYTQTSSIALVIRIIRLMAIFLSIYLMPIWLLCQVSNNVTIFNIPLLDSIPTASLVFQVVLVELLVEWIRLSFIHTPQAISGVMGFLFIFLLGESAVKLNLYTEAILVMVVLCNVCNFVTPNYELSLANKFFRVLITIMTIFFGLTGFSIGILLHFCVLLYTKSVHFSYLYPIIPFDYKEMKRLLLGAPIKIKKDLKK